MTNITIDRKAEDSCDGCGATKVDLREIPDGVDHTVALLCDGCCQELFDEEDRRTHERAHSAWVLG